MKKYKGKTWHYCDDPNQRLSIKWHIHATSECRIHTFWLATEECAAATANIAPVTEIADNEASAAESTVSIEFTSSNNSNVTDLLASALNMVGGNNEIQYITANAINAAASLWKLYHELILVISSQLLISLQPVSFILIPIILILCIPCLTRSVCIQLYSKTKTLPLLTQLPAPNILTTNIALHATNSVLRSLLQRNY